MVVIYYSNRNLTKQAEEWYNTTYGLASIDLAYANANAVYQDLIYTVGNLKERMYFDYFPTLNPNISIGPIKKALIIRNDDYWTVQNGGFKSYSGDDKEIAITNEISIYPNPNNGSFFINGVNSEDKIEVFDILGKSLSFELSFSKDKVYIEVKNPTSIVLIKVNDVGYQVMINE